MEYMWNSKTEGPGDGTKKETMGKSGGVVTRYWRTDLRKFREGPRGLPLDRESIV